MNIFQCYIYNWIKIFVIVCICFVFVLSLIHVVNSTHTVRGARKHCSYVIRYYVQFHLGDHLANGTVETSVSFLFGLRDHLDFQKLTSSRAASPALSFAANSNRAPVSSPASLQTDASSSSRSRSHMESPLTSTRCYLGNPKLAK